MSEPEKRVYAPRVFSFARRPDDRLQTSRGAPAAEPRVKTDTVYHVDRKDTWRKIDVCPCFREESFYPQVVSLFDCLNRNFGERGPCTAEQTAVDAAIMADVRNKAKSEAA